MLSNGDISLICRTEELPLEADDLQVLGDPALTVSCKAILGPAKEPSPLKDKEPCRSWAFRLKSSWLLKLSLGFSSHLWG